MKASKFSDSRKAFILKQGAEPLSVLPLESYRLSSVTMIRYRATLANGKRHVLVGWTDDDRITWVDA
jgi:hypothetical protein